MKFKVLLLLSSLFISSFLQAQTYINVCSPDTTVPVNLYAGNASCNATTSYPFGYTGPSYYGSSTYSTIAAESEKSTITLGSSFPVSWTVYDPSIRKCDWQGSNCTYGGWVTQSGWAGSYCSAAVPFSRVGSKVIKGQCSQQFNTSQCGCTWESSPFTGGAGFTVYRPASACAYDTLVLTSSTQSVSCSGSAWPKVVASSSVASSSAAASSSISIPSGANCTWPASPNTGAATYPGHVEVYYAIGACTNRYKEVYFDQMGVKINTNYR